MYSDLMGLVIMVRIVLQMLTLACFVLCAGQALATEGEAEKVVKPKSLPICSEEQLVKINTEEKKVVPEGKMEVGGHATTSNSNAKFVRSQINKKRDMRARELGCRRP